MRVISGLYKGRIIDGFDIDGTRPTQDRVKESLFGSIQDYLEDSVVLDLFSGSGNLGIEALSNGAKECYFVDNNSCPSNSCTAIKSHPLSSKCVANVCLNICGVIFILILVFFINLSIICSILLVVKLVSFLPTIKYSDVLPSRYLSLASSKYIFNASNA